MKRVNIATLHCILLLLFVFVKSVFDLVDEQFSETGFKMTEIHSDKSKKQKENKQQKIKSVACRDAVVTLTGSV